MRHERARPAEDQAGSRSNGKKLNPTVTRRPDSNDRHAESIGGG